MSAVLLSQPASSITTVDGNKNKERLFASQMSLTHLDQQQLSRSDSASKSFTNFFGKKKKTPQENSTCLLACTINFLKAPENKNAVTKLQKYLTRCKQIAIGTEANQSTAIANCDYLHIGLHNLLVNASFLPFESKKDVYTVLSSALKLSSACRSYFTLHAQQIATGLLSKLESHEMSFFAGNVLRILLKQQELLPHILNLNLIEKIIAASKNTVFEVSSEALETFHVIFKQKKHMDKTTLTSFLVGNHAQVLRMFFDLSETENYLAKRDILLTLSNILTDPANTKFLILCINEPSHLKCVMTILSDSEQGGIKEVALVLLETFLSNLSSIDSEKVRQILSRNKHLLVQCINSAPINDEQQQPQSFETEQRNKYLIHKLESL